jgi:hypothetical protein
MVDVFSIAYIPFASFPITMIPFLASAFIDIVTIHKSTKTGILADLNHNQDN